MATPTGARPAHPQVVIAFLGGRRARGYVFDFLPTRDRCRLFPSQTAKQEEGELVNFSELKAIFFLRETTDETTTQAPTPTSVNRRKLEVIFADKERLEGTTEGYSRERLGFFMVPDDPTGKIIRVFVINANVKSVKWL